MSRYQTVVALSGGLDSATLLADLARSQGAGTLLCVFVACGQRSANREFDAALGLAERYGADLKRLDLAGVFPGVALPDPDVPVGPAELAPPPLRNVVLVTALAALAVAQGAGRVALGLNVCDRRGYPDVSAPAVVHLEAAVRHATAEKVKLYLPFADWPKSQVVRHAHELQVPFALCWSCRRGLKAPCRGCASCAERLAAFRANELADPG